MSYLFPPDKMGNFVILGMQNNLGSSHGNPSGQGIPPFMHVPLSPSGQGQGSKRRGAFCG